MASSSFLLTFFTTCMLISTTVQPTRSLKALNTSSCIPFVLKNTICLDFLVTGSLVPTPGDSCCVRLKLITELDLPCLWDFFKGGKSLNLTRAESVLRSCGFPFPFPPFTTSQSLNPSEVVQAALTPESTISENPSEQVKTDPVDEEFVEAPESPVSAKQKSPRLLLA